MLASYIFIFFYFSGIHTSIALKTLFFLFQWGGGPDTLSPPPPPPSVSAYGVGQLLRTFSIAAYTVLEGTHNLVVVYDRQIGKFKTLVNRNNGFN